MAAKSNSYLSCCCRTRIKTCVILIVVAACTLFIINFASQVADIPASEHRFQEIRGRNEMMQAWRQEKKSKTQTMIPPVPCKGSKCAKYAGLYMGGKDSSIDRTKFCAHPHFSGDEFKHLFPNDHMTLECPPRRPAVRYDTVRGIITPSPDFICICEFISRVDDDHIEYINPILITQKVQIEDNSSSDFMRVSCINEQRKFSADKTFTDIRHETETLKSTILDLMNNSSESIDRVEYFTRVSPYPDGEKPPLCNTDKCLPFNVLVMGIGSLSAASFKRLLPDTYSLFVKEFNSVLFEGYNVVDMGSAGAFLPLLTGKDLKTQSGVLRHEKQNAYFVDQLDSLWKLYDQAGYLTLYAEDHPPTNTFNQFLHGFELQQTTHYMRPFWLAAEERKHKNQRYCVGNKPNHKVILDYLTQFYQQYPNNRKFSTVMFQELSHHDITHTRYLDYDLSEFFSEFLGLEDTIILLMTDYGRLPDEVLTSWQAAVESRMPLMSVLLPDRFYKLYEDLAKNMTLNEDKLITPYDIHAMLTDIINIPKIHHKQSKKSSKYGLSPFSKIPANRTCSTAGVNIHWCGCAKTYPVQLNVEQTDKIKQLIAHKLNELTTPNRDLCNEYKYKLIHVYNITRLVFTEQVAVYEEDQSSKFNSDTPLKNNYYRVTFSPVVKSKPSEIFEVSVEWHDGLLTSGYSLYSDIHRLSRSKQTTSQCKDKMNPYVLQYCQCKF